MPLYIQGRAAAVKKFRAVANNAEDLEEVWPLFGSYLSNRINRQFITQGADAGKPWRPLTPEYAARKAADGYGSRKILVRTGEMRRSFDKSAINIRPGKDRAIFGMGNQLAVWHQYGTRHNGRQVNPARPMLVVDERMRKHLRRLVVQHLKKEGRP